MISIKTWRDLGMISLGRWGPWYIWYMAIHIYSMENWTASASRITSAASLGTHLKRIINSGNKVGNLCIAYGRL